MEGFSAVLKGRGNRPIAAFISHSKSLGGQVRRLYESVKSTSSNV
jgi:hypothetical protein